MTGPGRIDAGRRAPVGRRLAAALLSAAAAVTWVTVAAAAAPTREDQVKAAFLHKFTLFTVWPIHSTETASSPFCIGVVAGGPLLEALRPVGGTLVGGQRLEVSGFPADVPADTLMECHMVFLPEDLPETRVRELLAGLAKSHALTVGTADRFLEMGGMVRLFLQGGKVRFSVNQAAAERAGLSFRTQLLRVAEPWPQATEGGH